jgi:hypothetical protein
VHTPALRIMWGLGPVLQGKSLTAWVSHLLLLLLQVGGLLWACFARQHTAATEQSWGAVH